MRSFGWIDSARVILVRGPLYIVGTADESPYLDDIRGSDSNTENF